MSEKTKPQDKRGEYMAKLLELVDEDHRVIEANTVALTKLADVICEMQHTMTLLVTQVTTSINQRNDAVPLRIFIIVVLVLVLLLGAVVGLDATNLYHLGAN